MSFEFLMFLFSLSQSLKRKENLLSVQRDHIFHSEPKVKLSSSPVHVHNTHVQIPVHIMYSHTYVLPMLSYQTLDLNFVLVLQMNISLQFQELSWPGTRGEARIRILSFRHSLISCTKDAAQASSLETRDRHEIEAVKHVHTSYYLKRGFGRT